MTQKELLESVLQEIKYIKKEMPNGELKALITDVNELKEDGYVLLRDAQSTYMKGEKRHPKWLILDPLRLNFHNCWENVRR